MRKLGTVLLLAVATLAVSAAPAARAGDPPAPAPNPLRSAEGKLTFDRVPELKFKDPRGLGRALQSIGTPSPQKADDIGFLTEYVVRETSRPLRLVALGSLQKLDPEGAGPALLKKAQGEKDVIRIALALECLGHVGTKAEAPAVLEYLKHASSMVAAAAADTLARIGTTKECDEIVDLGLAHPDSHVTDHAAWALQDLQRKPATAAAIFAKIAARKNDPRSIRAESAAALLTDKMAEAHKWTPGLEPASKLLFAAPATVEVKGVPDLIPRVQAMVDWMRDRMPAEHWLMCATVKQFRAGPDPETRPVLDADAIQIAPADCAIQPNKLAYLVFRQSVVLFRKRIGEPYKGHRGWEAGIFDSYDLCVVGKLYDAGPGGLSREKFVTQILSGKPWGGL